MSRIYSVEKTGKLPDNEAGVYLEFLREWGNMRGPVDGYEHSMENILEIMRKREYILGYPNDGPLILRFLNPHWVLPTKTPNQILEQGGSYMMSLYSDFKLTLGVKAPVVVYNAYFGDVPVMLRSKFDPTSATPEMMEKVGRDKNEPEATFLTNGRKRTFNCQENLSSGTILCYYKDLKLDPKTLVSSITTESGFALTAMYSIYFGAGRILRFDNFRGWSHGMKNESVDVLDAFTLLGYEEDGPDGMPLADFIVQFTRREWREKIKAVLSPSIAAYYSHRIEPTKPSDSDETPDSSESTEKAPFVDIDPLIVVIKRIRSETYPGLTRSRYIPLLKAELYSHIATTPNGIKIKAAALARQIVRLSEVDLGLTTHDDRNSYKNKRLKGPGPAMLHLFNLSMDELLKTFYGNYSSTYPVDKLKGLIESRPITQDYEHAFEKSWSPKGRPSMKATNYVELLKDNQYILQQTHVTKVVRGRDPNSKNFPIRAVQSSQPPFIDDRETPESGNVGLTNVKSSGSYISQHHDINEVIKIIDRIVIARDTKAVRWRYFNRDNNRESYWDTILTANGIVQGVCNGKFLRDRLTTLRRFGKIPRDTEIVLDSIDGYLYLKCDAGRPLIPLFVVNHNDRGVPRLAADDAGLSIDEFSRTLNGEDDSRRQISASDWRNAGVVDLVDPTEADREYVCIGLKRMQELVKTLELLREKLDTIVSQHDTIAKIPRYISLDDEFILLSLAERDILIADKLISLNRSLRRALERRDDIADRIVELAHDDNRNIPSFNDRLDSLRGERERVIAEINKYAGRITALITERTSTKSLMLEDVAIIINRLETQIDLAVRMCNFTYCLPDPMMIVGITSSLLLLQNHNPGPRQTFACKMIKQSMVLPSHSQRWSPVPCKYAVMNARGPVETVTYEHLGVDTHAVGVPVTIIMYVGQRVVEDMINISRQFAESGAAMCVISKIITKKIPAIGIRDVKGNTTTLMHVTNKLPKEIVARKRHGVFDNLGSDGIVLPGSVLQNGDCVIGAYLEITRPDAPTEYTDASRYVKKNKIGVVKDIVPVKNDDGGMVVHIHINETMTVERGDKWANPHAQKSTAGEILEMWEMPYSMKDGTTPDMMADIHCIPSRMTAGFLIEILWGRVHSLTGERIDGTPHHDHLSMEAAGDILENYGWSRGGKEDYYFPRTGKIIQAQVFSGVCHYYPLEHKAQPKLQNRYIGKSNARTHQSVTGIENDGGQREGHMEHDVIRTHGGSDVITQWATRAADYYVIYTCGRCDTQIFPQRFQSRTVFWCGECNRNVKRVHYAPSNVGYECLRKYSMQMGYHLAPILRPKVSLYLPNITDAAA